MLESSAESTLYGRKLCQPLRIEHTLQDITPILEATGCYRLREEAAKTRTGRDR